MMWLIWVVLVAVWVLLLVVVIKRRHTEALNAAMKRHPSGRDR